MDLSANARFSLVEKLFRPRRATADAMSAATSPASSPARSIRCRHRAVERIARSARAGPRRCRASARAGCDERASDADAARSTSLFSPSSTRVVSLSLSVAAASVMTLAAAAAPALAEDAAAVFSKTCAGCHAAGGNVVQAGATLFPADLQRNGVSDVDTIYDVISKGRNKMPGYGEECAPKGQCTFGPRLSDEDVRELSTYVLAQSKEGWK